METSDLPFQQTALSGIVSRSDPFLSRQKSAHKLCFKEIPGIIPPLGVQCRFIVSKSHVLSSVDITAITAKVANGTTGVVNSIEILYSESNPRKSSDKNKHSLFIAMGKM